MNAPRRAGRVARAALLGALLAVLSAGCGEDTAQDWFPSPAGAKWRYLVHVQTTELKRESREVHLGLPPVVVEGRHLERRRINAGMVHFHERAEQGIARVAVQRPEDAGPVFDPVPSPVLPVPTVVGARWRQASVTRVLETTVDPFRRKYRMEEPIELDFSVEALDDEVTVPAGRFTGCLRVRATGTTRFKGDKTIFPSDITVEQVDWYARGIGLVLSKRVERTTSKVLPGGSFEMELEFFEP